MLSEPQSVHPEHGGNTIFCSPFKDETRQHMERSLALGKCLKNVSRDHSPIGCVFLTGRGSLATVSSSTQMTLSLWFSLQAASWTVSSERPGTRSRGNAVSLPTPSPEPTPVRCLKHSVPSYQVPAWRGALPPNPSLLVRPSSHHSPQSQTHQLHRPSPEPATWSHCTVNAGVLTMASTLV